MKIILVKYRLLVRILILIAAIPLFLYCASPKREAYNKTNNTDFEGNPLTISWDDPNDRPKLIVWIQSRFLLEPVKVPKDATQITIKRKGVNKTPQKLLIVPADNRLSPQVLSITPEEKTINFSAESILSNELWFWGIPPENICSECNKPTAIRINLSLGRNKNELLPIYGTFAWKISKSANGDDQIPLLFFLENEDRLSAIKIEGFNRASAESQTFNNLYSQSISKFALQTNADVFGKSFEVNFETNPSFDINDCN